MSPAPAVAFALLSVAAAGPQKLEQLELMRDKSVLVDTARALKRTSITNPEIANAVVISPHQLLVNGNRTGTTNLIAWFETGENVVYNITVSTDTDLIKRRLDELLPHNNIEVSGAGDLIILSGDVDDLGHVEQAQAIAESLAPVSHSTGREAAASPAGAPQVQSAANKPKVVNLIKVASLQQVMLEVTVAEVDRDTVRELGVNLQLGGRSVFGLSNAGGVSDPAGTVLPGATGGATPNFSLSSAVSVLVGIPHFDLGALIHALQGKGVVKILAEPSLITLSGERASFLAGGEFPIPIQQQLTAVTVVFKEFGVRLGFTPTVLGSGRINLKVSPEVSSLDFGTAVHVGSFTVPGLKTRKVDSVVELQTGQSFAIAGLIDDEMVSQVDQLPVLGALPIIGALFRSSRFREHQTELLIVATPRLVRPLAAGQRPDLPVDGMRAPSALESFLLGSTFGATGEKPAGPWGFSR